MEHNWDSDFEFVEWIYSERLAKRADAEGLGGLSVPERNVLLAWWAKGEIDNGGFSQLYGHPEDIDAVIKAFSDIGLKTIDNACSMSKNRFENGHPPSGLEERREAVDSIVNASGSDDPWDEENKLVWDVTEAFDSAVASYIRSNPIHFDL